MKCVILLVILCLFYQKAWGQTEVSGVVLSSVDSTEIDGITVIFETSSSVAVTNKYGQFYRELEWKPRFIAFKSKFYDSKTVYLDSLSKLSDLVIFLEPNVNALSEIAVGSSKQESYSVVKKEEISVHDINVLPTIGGEKDIFKAYQTKPGVTSVAEGSAQMLVRGGTNDQNLVLVNGVPLLGTTQLFGFVSSINPNLVEHSSFYKGVIPSDYYGRVSSVLDVELKGSNLNNIVADVEAGIITTKVFADLPIIKGKTGLVLGYRRNFFDILRSLIKNPNTDVPDYNFNDFYLGLDTKLSGSKKIKLFYYNTAEKWRVEEGDVRNDTKTDYIQNPLHGLFGLNFNSSNKSTNYELSINHSFYNYQINSSYTDFSGNDFSYRFFNKLQQTVIKNQFVKKIDSLNVLNYGVDLSFQQNIPHENQVLSTTTLIEGKSAFNSLLTPSLYLSWQSVKWKKFRSYVGFRSIYFLPSGFFLHEPKVAIDYSFENKVKISFGFQRAYQWEQVLANPGLGPNEDLWILFSEKSQISTANLINVELSKELKAGTSSYEVVLGVYRKFLNNQIAYLDGFGSKNLTFRTDRESNYSYLNMIAFGNTMARGIELSIEKRQGVVRGWVSYTLAKAESIFPEINNGLAFPSISDIRNVVSIVGIYNPNHKWELATNFSFNSGRPITIPVTVYYRPSDLLPNLENVSNETYSPLLSYSKRNEFNMPVNHRLDLTVKRYLRSKIGDGSMELGIYNMYNKRNVNYYTINYQSANNSFNLKPISLFSTVLSGSIKINLY